MLTFGIPWAGTLTALQAVTKGVSISFLFIRLLSAAEGQRLIGRSVAAYDLQPADPTLNLFFAADGTPTTVEHFVEELQYRRRVPQLSVHFGDEAGGIRTDRQKHRSHLRAAQPRGRYERNGAVADLFVRSGERPACRG